MPLFAMPWLIQVIVSFMLSFDYLQLFVIGIVLLASLPATWLVARAHGLRQGFQAGYSAGLENRDDPWSQIERQAETISQPPVLRKHTRETLQREINNDPDGSLVPLNETPTPVGRAATGQHD
jgi:hypothetical protein